MPRVIALHAPAGQLAKMLIARGYRVIDFAEASRPGVQVDALLCTGYQPERLSASNSLSEFADITIGTGSILSSHPVPLTINITGLRPEQAINILEQRLHHSL